MERGRGKGRGGYHLFYFPLTGFCLKYHPGCGIIPYVLLRALNNYDVIRPSRAARKVIFSLRLCCPLRLRRRRRRSECQQPAPGRPFCTAAEPGLAVACVNARSVGNNAALLCRTIIEESLDVFIIVETWHERSESTTLQRVIPSGYPCIDAARPIGPDAAVNTVEFQNYGGLAFIHRDSVRFQKRSV